MHTDYSDIRDRLGEPLWWDEVGCPRYCLFSPDHVNSIYAGEVAFLEIACQNCGRRFEVAVVSDSFDQIEGGPSLRRRVEDNSIHYGDPPNVDCCAAGPCMNCEDLRVLQFWYRDYEAIEWRRVSDLERTLE